MGTFQDDMPSHWRRIIAAADRDPRRAALLARRAHAAAHEPVAQAWAALGLGWALLRYERLHEARAQLQAAQVRFAALGHAAALRQCRHALLAAALAAGGGAEHQADWRRLADDCDAAGQPLDAARVRIDQAAHLNVLGEARETLQLLPAIEPVIARLGTAADAARLSRIAAIAHGMLGDWPVTHAELDRAMAGYASLRRRIDLAKCTLERSWAYQRQEQYQRALAELAAALAVFERYDLPLQIAFCRRNIGFVASRIGRYDWALAETSRARDLFDALERHDQAATCDVEVGSVAYFSGLLDLALASYRRARQTYARLGIARLRLINQRNEALVLRGQGRAAEALALLRELEEDVAELGDQLESVELIHAQAHALADLGQLDAALQRSRQAEVQFAALGIARSAAACQLEQGWIHLGAGDQAAAARCLEQAAPLLQEHADLRWRADYGLARLAELAGDGAAALGHYRRASATVAGLRRTLASEHASSGLFAQAQQLHHDALRCAAAGGDATLVLELAEQQRALALQRQMLRGDVVPPTMQAELERQQLELRALTQRRATATEVDAALQAYVELLLRARHLQIPEADAPHAALDLPGLAARLDVAHPGGWLLLSYAHLGDELLAVACDRRGCFLTRAPVTARLRWLIDRATLPQHRRLTYLDLRQGEAGRAPWAELAELAELLIPAAARERLAPATRLIVVPDGPLHAIPWAALRLAEQWLCERCVVQVLPALSLWEPLAERVPGGAEALLVGCSQFGERAVALPHVGDELSLVAASWPAPARRLEEETATRSALLALGAQGELERYGLVHIASHAQIVSRRGVLAHIKLWDDDLLLDEISRLRLRGALVVLSVCDGAGSDVLPGEELLGLSRGLLAAGARDVIASLWPVYDGVTRFLVAPFYRRLSAGADPAAALALAQRELIREGAATDERLASPFFWGRFCAIGAGVAAGLPAGGTRPAAPLVDVEAL